MLLKYVVFEEPNSNIGLIFSILPKEIFLMSKLTNIFAQHFSLKYANVPPCFSRSRASLFS